MKTGKKWKKTGTLFLTAAVLGTSMSSSGAGLLTSLASGSGTTPIAQYDEVSMVKFADNVLEYWEIPGLIEHYNPSYLNKLEAYYYNPDGSTGMSLEQLVNLAAELRMEAKALEEEMDDKLEKGQLKKYSDGHQDYKENIKTLKRYARAMEDAQDGSAATRRVLRMARNELTVEISAQMREYQSLLSQQEIHRKQQEIAEAAYHSAKRQADLGMYSQAELRAAENAWNAARIQADASAVEVTKAKADLITALGWSREGNPEIVRIPEPNTAKAAGYQPTVDLTQAINFNYDMVEIRNSNASAYGGKLKKQEELENAENNVKMKLEMLHKDVLAKDEAYRGALLGWESAEKKKNLADRKYALGIISRMEFLQAEAEYLTAKASFEQVGLDLTAAMERYEWAVNGLIVQ